MGKVSPHGGKKAKPQPLHGAAGKAAGNYKKSKDKLRERGARMDVEKHVKKGAKLPPAPPTVNPGAVPGIGSGKLPKKPEKLQFGAPTKPGNGGGGKKPVSGSKPATGTRTSTPAGSRSTGTSGGYTGTSGSQRRTVRNPNAVAAGVGRAGKAGKAGGGKRRKAAGAAPKDPLTALVDSIEQAQLAALRGQQQQAEGISSEYQAELDRIASTSQQGWGQALAAATADGANPTQTDYLKGMFGSNAEGAGALQQARSAFTRNTGSGAMAGLAANRIGAPGIDGYFSKMKLANATADRESANDFAGLFAQVKAGRPELEQKYRMQAAAAEAAGAKDLFGQQMDQAKLQYQYDALNANTQAKYASIAAGLAKKGGKGAGKKSGDTARFDKYAKPASIIKLGQPVLDDDGKPTGEYQGKPDGFYQLFNAYVRGGLPRKAANYWALQEYPTALADMQAGGYKFDWRTGRMVKVGK